MCWLGWSAHGILASSPAPIFRYAHGAGDEATHGICMGSWWRGVTRDHEHGWRCVGRCREFHFSRKFFKIYAAAFAVMVSEPCLVLCPIFIQFSAAFSVVLVFPFLPFMVLLQFLLPEIEHVEETDTGICNY